MTIHADLTSSPRAVPHARALVAAALSDAVGRMMIGDVGYNAQLVVSELVTNAVMHARTELHLGISHDDRTLLVAVTDGALPGAMTAAPEQWRLGPELVESGRGMLIIATIADDFGWRPRTDMAGKIMWASFRLHGRSADAPVHFGLSV